MFPAKCVYMHLIKSSFVKFTEKEVYLLIVCVYRHFIPDDVIVIGTNPA